ncbi:hypothetical protein [Ferroglobus sp.]|uniref:hypothetical protein n=1 Tax=Ferroglobus sp. TaxID=2614230 RepID=UPI0025C5E688|nr:hypothetical protein [Ferroglobus sp.]
MLSETLALILTFLLNIPFGYWRAGTRRMSKEWFLAVHAPVPFVATLRFLSSSSLYHVPIFVFAYFSGQLVGSKVRESFSKRIEVSKCFVADLGKFINYLKAFHK